MRIEFEYGSYNPSQYGMPWGAIVKLEGWRVVWNLSAGTFEGDSVKGGKVYIKCQPGDIIATGQNFCDREDYIHDGTLYVVEEDGSLKKVGKVTILEYGEGRQ